VSPGTASSPDPAAGDNARLPEDDAGRLREKLVAVFVHRGATEPDDLAQEVLNRLSAKQSAMREKGEKFATQSDIVQYAHGIARKVLQEHRRASARFAQLDPDHDPVAEGPGALDPEALLLSKERMGILEALLKNLEPAERRLIEMFYADDEDHLESHLDISRNALRIRIHRTMTNLRRFAGKAGFVKQPTIRRKKP